MTAAPESLALRGGVDDPPEVPTLRPGDPFAQRARGRLDAGRCVELPARVDQLVELTERELVQEPLAAAAPAEGTAVVLIDLLDEGQRALGGQRPQEPAQGAGDGRRLRDLVGRVVGRVVRRRVGEDQQHRSAQRTAGRTSVDGVERLPGGCVGQHAAVHGVPGQVLGLGGVVRGSAGPLRPAGPAPHVRAAADHGVGRPGLTTDGRLHRDEGGLEREREPGRAARRQPQGVTRRADVELVEVVGVVAGPAVQTLRGEAEVGPVATLGQELAEPVGGQCRRSAEQRGGDGEVHRVVRRGREVRGQAPHRSRQLGQEVVVAAQQRGGLAAEGRPQEVVHLPLLGPQVAQQVEPSVQVGK